VTKDLKAIYQSSTEEDALLSLDKFGERWDDKYPQISKSWRTHWQNLNTLFSYPPDIRCEKRRRKENCFPAITRQKRWCI